MSGAGDSLAPLRRAPEEVAGLLRVLGNPDRLAILCHLAGRECSVSELRDALALRQPALSQQLGELRDSGLVKTRRRSRNVYYSLTGQRVLRLLEALAAGLGDGSAPSPPLPSPATRRDVGEAAHFARVGAASRS